jgi:hypothetical protein
MSDSYDGFPSGNEGDESGVATLTEGEYSDDQFDADFPVEDSHDLSDDHAGEDDDSEDAEPRKGTAAKGRAAKSTAPRPKAGAIFGWSDVESILTFVTKFNEGSDKERTALKAVFGVPAKADALATAQALHGGGTSLTVYKEATSFIDAIIKGKFGLFEGFGLISDLSKRDDDFVRDFFRTINAFLGEEVRYRKNAPLPTLLEPLITTAQKSLSGADSKTIEWIDEILSVWPK